MDKAEASPVSATPGATKVEQPKEDQQSPEEVIGPEPEKDEAAMEEQNERLRRQMDAKAQALTLEIIGDLPYAEVKPPENVLFVCKLNPVTEDEDLQLIFSRFGKIISCEVIRDKRTGDSLQYAFIEFEHQKDCEQAYFKMQGVLIDDHRIHVDFSQSVSRLSDTWRKVTNTKRSQQSGGFGGIAHLEKKRQFRAPEARVSAHESASGKRDLVFAEGDVPEHESKPSSTKYSHRRYSRSRSPERHQPWRGPPFEREKRRRASRERDRYRDDYSYRDRGEDRERHRR